MIALTPAVGNAAGMIETNCDLGKAGKHVISFLPISGKQKIKFGFSKVTFDIPDNIIVRLGKTREVFMINIVSGIFSHAGRHGSIKEAINSKKSEEIGTCTFKNLSLIKTAILPPAENMKKLIIAAENGDKNAAFTLAGIYSGTLGGGDFTDHRMAAKYWRVAAEQGHPDAQHLLAWNYLRGKKGHPQDDKTAVKWFTLAAEQGNADSQLWLGTMYYLDQGVPKDPEVVGASTGWNQIYGLMWVNIAASNGNKKAVKFRNKVVQEKRYPMSPTQILEAKLLTRECVKKEYKGCSIRIPVNGVCLPETSLSHSPIAGKCSASYGKRDYKTALREFQALAEQGIAAAQANLGKMYVAGHGVPKDKSGFPLDLKTGIKWLKLAAEQGDATGQVNLDTSYKYGIGVPQDDKTAMKWYKLAAEQGDPRAIETLDYLKNK